MPLLTNAWFADRAPGQGRILQIANGGVQVSPLPIGGPIGVPGTGPLPGPGPIVNPTTPGAPMPQPGAPLLPVVAAMTGVGFDGTTFLTGLPTPSAPGTSLSLSCWLDFNPLLAPGFITPNLSGAAALYGTNPLTTGALVDSILISPTWVLVDALTPSPPYLGSTDSQFPLNPVVPNHWYHFMVSYQVGAPYFKDPINKTGSLTLVQCVACVNDTVIANGQFSLPDNTTNPVVASHIDASHADQAQTPPAEALANNIGEEWSTQVNLKGGMAEMWVDWNRFVDWTVAANRAKFHNTNGSSWVPCDLGASGAKPFGSSPMIYLSGNAANFPYNRAKGNTLAAVTGALLDVSDSY